MKLINTAQIVKVILEEQPETRNDDCLLWLKVIEKVCALHSIPDFLKTMTANNFLAMAKYSQFPHYETVSRARRKVQEQYPELRGTIETQAARAELEQEYREYARNGRQF